MNHIPRFFIPKEKAAARTAMDSRNIRQKPRLDRRNAAKNIDYDASPSSSSLGDSSSVAASLVTRSLDLSDKTSFRIEGVDGEFERICRSLGLSPEDFSIPTAAWESSKIRSSSDLLPRSRLNNLISPKESETGSEPEAPAEVAVGDLSARVLNTVRIRDETELTRDGSAESRAWPGVFSGRDSRDGGQVTQLLESTRGELNASGASCIIGTHTGGIKGIRPPVLKPPPAMTLPAVDDGCSTWDLCRDFAPKDIRASSIVAVYSSSDDEGKEEADIFRDFASKDHRTSSADAVNRSSDEEEEKRTIVRETIKTEEDIGLSDSFSTSNDDDSSSSTTISPNAKSKRSITPLWVKGELLGRGSFGTVYEGISE